ncbi:HRDC domain-containing protein [Clostridium uliginosum]|uniref:Nuclease-related domain-containing protein n=1 Tax=Clostridium uliginosum TaxID=119641 RepID=A0A1I1JTY3_9CLOT|nr:HRDC domain-containing protein [Clostridium uliginosum]SFC49283.1 Nuclease-related domain-containing protein [Clostridium uliginosum]
MSFLDRLFNVKRTITEPIFLKEFENSNNTLNDLQELSNKVISNKKRLIDRDIFFLKQTLYGEKNVYNELKNSFIPMLALHDIKLEHNDYIAQYDFILITSKCVFILKTKQLNGDIDITEDGDFVRIIKNRQGKFIKKQGMYNPISINERNANVLKEILQKEKLLSNISVKSIVVISNPKSIVNKSKCPQNIKENLYKYDQIGSLIKKLLEDDKSSRELSENTMHEIANYLINNNKVEKIDYVSKYLLIDKDFKKEDYKIEAKEAQIFESNLHSNIDNSTNNNFINNDKTSCDDSEKLYELLRQYRLKASREEGFKAYMVFTNEELNFLIESKPKSKDELLNIKGFGPKKVEKYGDAILDILNMPKY